MAVDKEIRAGLEPGLRFAMLLPPEGPARDLGWKEIQSWKPSDGFLWVHLERDHADAQSWVRERAGIDPTIVPLLLAEETRPRVQDVGDHLFVVLRGVNKSALDDDETADSPLVPIHIWGEASRCVSLRDKSHSLSALRDLRLAMLAGRGPRTPGTLLAVIAEKIVDHLGELIDDMEDEIEKAEDRLSQGIGGRDMRMDISLVRRQAVQLRRYLAPQRDALYRLEHDDASWLDPAAKLRLREVNDRVTRHIEDIDALRQRATILNEDFTNMVTERASRASNRLTGMAAMVLPPSLLAGMMGMNVGGIPGAQEPNAFWWFCVMVAAMMPVTWAVLKTLKWL